MPILVVGYKWFNKGINKSIHNSCINLLYKAYSLHQTVITHLFKLSLMVSHADSDIWSWQFSHLLWEMIPNLIVLRRELDGLFAFNSIPSIKMEWEHNSNCVQTLLIVYVMSCNMCIWRYSIKHSLYFNSEATILWKFRLVTVSVQLNMVYPYKTNFSRK